MIESVLPLALKAFGGTEDDLVFLAGSTTDGLANRNSDIDLYVIGDTAVGGSETAARQGEKTSTIGYHDDREVNLCVLEPEGLVQLKDVFRRSVASLDGDKGIEQLVTDDNLKILHRIRTGQPLQRPDLLDGLRADIGTADLSRYLFNASAIAAVNRLTDVAGELADGHEQSAQWMFREALVHAGHCALAADGETNPSGKWLVRMLLRGSGFRERIAGLLLTQANLDTDVQEIKAGLAALIDAQGEIAGPYVRNVARKKLG